MELALVAVLFYIAHKLGCVAHELRDIGLEMTTARWERGQREQLRDTERDFQSPLSLGRELADRVN